MLVPTVAHIRELEAFRQSFRPAYEHVISRLTQVLRLQVTGRPAKSTHSIVEKLRRETTRLSQIQDIAGCRLVVDSAPEQMRYADQIRLVLGDVSIDDRRKRPSHGYRAIHIIAPTNGRPIEIQVRTSLQHLWAEISEKFSDISDPSIKYGGGAKHERAFLDDLSNLVQRAEIFELRIAAAQTRKNDASKRRKKKLKEDIASMQKLKLEVHHLLREIQKAASELRAKTE